MLEILAQVGIGLGAIAIAEIIRDCYHLAGHHWQPLQAWHTLHHKVYRPDLTVTSTETYRKAEWYNDVPEATVMVLVTGVLAWLSQELSWTCWLGCIYSVGFWSTSLARANGFWLFTDFSHKPGTLTQLPASWLVNRTYHWRHHFDQANAYYSGTFTLVDKILGTALSLKGKTIAVTGANGSLGRSLLQQLQQKGAKVIAITSSVTAADPKLETWQWQVGQEAKWQAELAKVDILILNHGINVLSDRSPEAIQQSFEVNALSTWRWLELFFATVTESKHKALKEVWINTSEAEVNPAFSPLYELSKRTIGDLVTLRSLDAPCIVRKLILGPFKSGLNPIGIMSANWVAWAVVALAQRDFRHIIVTVNPFTYIFYPLKEFTRSLYFRLFSRASHHDA
ncbi:MAG: bifunctional sterol desaturase/short chain dehydrogenase [Pseudanabaenaceae cyanobacterium bins.68]|nr:bifunctional sterol desaturase/short chain dehydrogenase [Pseudanabaenaceae cyanobacterium bins.68]